MAVPERVTIYPDAMRGSKYRDAVRSAGEVARLEALRQSGIEFIDLTQTVLGNAGPKKTPSSPRTAIGHRMR